MFFINLTLILSFSRYGNISIFATSLKQCAVLASRKTINSKSGHLGKQIFPLSSFCANMAKTDRGEIKCNQSQHIQPWDFFIICGQFLQYLIFLGWNWTWTCFTHEIFILLYFVRFVRFVLRAGFLFKLLWLGILRRKLSHS